jgi:hypothetical protein
MLRKAASKAAATPADIKVE